jgi:hypothetical protein
MEAVPEGPLMYARGMGGLGLCDPETGVCATDQAAYVPPPVQNPVDTSGIWSSWICGQLIGYAIPGCTPPTPAEVAKDTTNYGGQLSPEAQAEATAMAQNIVARDPLLQPQPNVDIAVWAAVGIGILILMRQ